MICANLHSKYLLNSNKNQTYALFLHRFFVSLQQTNSKSYGKEPFKQVCLALVETINKAKKITFEEINEKWLDIIFPLRVVNADAKILIF